MKFELNDKVYDVLKWLALIALPALAVLYNVLAGVWGWPCAAGGLDDHQRRDRLHRHDHRHFHGAVQEGGQGW